MNLFHGLVSCVWDITKTDLENRFPSSKFGAVCANIGKVVGSVVFVPPSCWPSIFGRKQNPQLTARGPTHSGIKVDHCAAAN